MELPEEFISTTHALMGDERFERYLKSFEEPAPVSIRLNPSKCEGLSVSQGIQVPWCEHGYYLPQRPNFTFDPLLHAGCYYVQEASSMFLYRVLAQHLPNRPLMALDLCAAPGGKSTLMRSLLPAGSVLYSNEPVRQRANILAENMMKWGQDNCIVTNNLPQDYRKARMHFDVILCDVPCSGEGMFRKDEATISEWSQKNVEKCWRLQREIVENAWACLNPGGLLIYSTCTFNTKENEENIQWICNEYEAEVLAVDTEAAWGITGSLLDGFSEHVYRFIPGITKGEGLFMCVMRKHGTETGMKSKQVGKNNNKGLNVIAAVGEQRREPIVEIGYADAIAYLRHEALILPADAPRGVVQVSFEGHPLGLAKNIGTRTNNLYPKEWKIKTTHIPNEYEAILRHT